MRFLESLFGSAIAAPGELLRRKYAAFRRLLSTNNEILERISELEGAMAGGQRLALEELRVIAASVHALALSMVEDLDVVADGRYASLRGNVERIAVKIEEAMQTVKGSPITEACLPLERVDRSLVDAVGGKVANLGEVRNVVGLPVPPGFAVSAFAYRAFVSGARIQERLTALWDGVDWDDLTSVHRAAEKMQSLVLAAEIPQDVKEAITLAAHDLYRQAGGRPRVSLRSSAIGEDSHTSFAGQYSSFLNVPLEQVLRRYKETVASKFGARALFYMHSKGFREEEIAMSVGCFLMMEARAAGVAYTVDPNDPDRDEMTVAAVWGLGRPVVDGSMTPDIYLVPRDPYRGRVRRQLVAKPRRLVCARDGGVLEEEVPGEMWGRPCLDDEQLGRLAQYMRALETHYRCPQDIEWVLDPQGRLSILQTRPLTLPETASLRPAVTAPPPELLLVSGGATACPGAGAGPVVHAESDEELSRFPQGGVLVARQNSPRFVNVMTRAAAVVTDLGSVTGHMASLAREYGVPTICNAEGATRLLADGLEVTVDATTGSVYRGRVEELVRQGRVHRRATRDLPSRAVQERVTARIAHLNLTDPSKNSFRAKSCATYHDVIRFCHEMSISEMFHINDYASLRERGMAFRLETTVPLGIYVIDLGDGLAVELGVRSVTPDQITSVPMRALWRGITTPGILWAGARPIDVGGFLSAMASTVVDGARSERGLGDSSYAMVGAHYVNFGSRLGYHFTMLESVCSGNVHENYVLFRFKGGAAELQRRERRVRFLAEVLDRHGFEVDCRRDLLNAWMKKREREAIEERLEMLGRLMGCARQLDVAMHAETRVQQYVEAFLASRFDLFDAEVRDGGE